MSNKKIETPNDEDFEDVVASEESLDEATQAAETLKGGSKPDDNPKSRIEMMTAVLKGMDTMPKKDLVKWFNQTQDLFGPGKTYGVGDNSAKNAASVDMKSGSGPKTKDPMPKLNVKEDVEEMFDGQDLSEEFKEKASTLFEAALNARMIAETARLEEEYESKLNEQIEAVTTELTEKLDNYLDYVVENWMKENEVAIETSLRNELMDDFIESLKGVFTEHYIDVPQNKLDVLEALAAKVEELETRLNETIEENVELRKAVEVSEAETAFEQVSEGLALTQVERFRTLAEGIEFDGDISAYTKKLNTIKEQYFAEKSSSTIVEEVSGENSLTEEVHVAPEMKRYLQAISRTVKK